MLTCLGWAKILNLKVQGKIGRRPGYGIPCCTTVCIASGINRYLCFMQENWFKDWFNSPYYHQLYFKRDEQEAAAFIDHLISYLKPPPGSFMLDVACGKGRHSV